ncbi:multiple C2 domain and transmembrane region protein 16 [Aristolochia californica]|uniref:multiple C2 domain and transmembrane region protein 16 n=1 Tax=Aristolochia californica TaxID=171875 RepID=UPI0035E09563
MATIARKLIVEVADARNLLPKDGHGTSSPFVVLDYNGQRRKTQTVRCDLNPAWNETLEFSAEGESSSGDNMLEADVFHDRRVGPTRRNNFLGRVRLDSRQFVRKGEEALIYFPLEKKSFFSWIQGEIGFRIFYVDEEVPPPPQPDSTPPPAPEVEDASGKVESTPAPESQAAPPADPPAEAVSDVGKSDQPAASEPVVERAAQPPPADAGKSEQTENRPPSEAEQPAEAPAPPPAEATEATPPPAPENPPVTDPPPENPPVTDPPPENKNPVDPSEPPQPSPPDPEKEAASKWDPSAFPTSPVDSLPNFNRAERIFRRPPSETFERDLGDRMAGVGMIERSSCDLVEKMHYLFVRVVKARYLPFASTPFVKLAVSSGRQVRTETARKIAASVYEWDQIFAFGGTALESTSTLEVSVWDPARKKSDVESDFLGGVCFDVTEIPTRDPPDSPLAPQWYRLEGGGVHRGDLMVATWIGTQADESFADAWKTDTAGTQVSRSKVYLSPKLWYLRATILEAQDFFPLSITALTDTSFHIRAQLGFQVQKTRPAVSANGAPSWNEDLLFVAAEPFGESSLILSVENRTGKEKTVFGVAETPLSCIERRVDDRKVVSRWIDMESPGEKKQAAYNGRLHVRVCFDGGYHVMDEPAHVSSDFRPTARQLWKPAIGSVELGIVGCRNLIPVKTVAGKGTADAYAVAKYGEKWVRSRTVADCLNPKWNEQYTWQVYDPCTVLTVAIFDSRAAPPPGSQEPKETAARLDYRIGKVRIRISTLEHGRVYKCTYPLLLLLPSGAKRMGEIDLAVRFVRTISAMDVLNVYTRPILPRMHYIKPIGALHQEALRGVAARIVAMHLSRSEPPLPREVALYLLDADSQTFSMRKVRVNWARIVNVLAGPIDLVRWVEQTRTWRNPTATLMAHALLILLVWHPDLVIPTVAFYVFGIGAWNYRGRSRGPLAQPCTKLSQIETVDRDELDEEFDTVPSSRPSDVTRARYDKLRALGVRVQAVLGDVATQGERVQALVTWRDPRATLIFVGMCLMIAIVLYVVPPKMVAMAGGFYYLRHPMFRDRMPPPALNFFRRLPSLSDRIM